jgi:hypothetical protein
MSSLEVKEQDMKISLEAMEQEVKSIQDAKEKDMMDMMSSLEAKNLEIKSILEVKEEEMKTFLEFKEQMKSSLETKDQEMKAMEKEMKSLVVEKDQEMKTRLEAKDVEMKALHETKEREVDITVQELRNKLINIEGQLVLVTEDKRRLGLKSDFALNQAKRWEKLVEELEAEKNSMATKIEEMAAKPEPVPESTALELTKYLELYREARADLKQEKMKGEAMIGQWRYYRSALKQSEKRKKQITSDAQELLKDPEVDVYLLKKFVAQLKKRLSDEEEDEEEEAENADVVAKGKATTPDKATDVPKRVPLGSRSQIDPQIIAS